MGDHNNVNKANVKAARLELNLRQQAGGGLEACSPACGAAR